MALGTPVITSDAIGCNDLITHDINGLKCYVRNFQDLANKIIYMDQMTLSRKNILSHNARQFIEKNYNMKILINSYIKVITT
tara:strand:- start:16 stop:261 length:246 start_codon:yes stop_codon:yes gene_type:complete